MSLVNYYINKYLKKVKAKYGDKVYLEAHLDGHCIVKSETDNKVIFECNSFEELMSSIG